MTTTTPSVQRYHALDCARAAAMLLGVLYHALMFGGMAGGFGPGRGGASMALQDWLHSFRMPLFFLISGFFCAMMFQKYGPVRYYARRWLRIGLPLFICLFTLVPFYLSLRGMGPGGGPGSGGGRPACPAA